MPLPDPSRFHQGVLDALTAHVCVLDAAGKILAVNRAWRAFAAANPPLGTNVNIGADYFAVCKAATGEDAATAHEALRALRAMARGEMPEFTLEYPCHSPDTRRWFELRATRLTDEIPGRLVVAHTNVTQRKEAETALRASEERFRAIADYTADLECWFGPDGRLLWVNPVVEQITGYSVAECLAMPGFPSPLFLEEDAAGNNASFQGALKGSRGNDWEFRFIRKDGDERWGSAAWQPIYGRDGTRLGHRSSVRDITDRKRAEVALRASRELHRSLLQTAFSGFWRADIQGRLLEVNPAYCRMSGYTESELLSMSIADVEATESPVEMRAHIRRITAQGHHHSESRHRRKDGSVFDVEVSTQFLSADGGQVVAFLRDITERKRAEEERALALARLAMVEEQERHRLSRELHDQIAQRLVALAVELKTLETNLAAGRPQAHRVRALRKAVDDLQQQVRQIAWDLHVGEPAESGLECALQGFVEDWSERASVPVDCECRGLGEKRLPAAVEATLYRVAREALANVEQHAQARRVSVLLEREASLARLTVEDDGRGFDVDAIQKSPEAAQRLGLLGMKERVALVGGAFLIESSPGTGTTILVRIPIPAETKPTSQTEQQSNDR